MEWLVIDTEKGEMIRLKEIKKEKLQLEKYLDNYIKYENKYVIFREEEIG